MVSFRIFLSCFIFILHGFHVLFSRFNRENIFFLNSNINEVYPKKKMNFAPKNHNTANEFFRTLIGTNSNETK